MKISNKWHKRRNYKVKGLYQPYSGYGDGKKNVRQLMKQTFWKEQERQYGQILT